MAALDRLGVEGPTPEYLVALAEDLGDFNARLLDKLSEMRTRAPANPEVAEVFEQMMDAISSPPGPADC